MKREEIENIVDQLIQEGKSIDQIIDELAQKNCLYSLVKAVFVKKQILGAEEIEAKLDVHDHYSQKTNKNNPFTSEFLKSFKEKD